MKSDFRRVGHVGHKMEFEGNTQFMGSSSQMEVLGKMGKSSNKMEVLVEKDKENHL